MFLERTIVCSTMSRLVYLMLIVSISPAFQTSIPKSDENTPYGNERDSDEDSHDDEDKEAKAHRILNLGPANVLQNYFVEETNNEPEPHIINNIELLELLDLKDNTRKAIFLKRILKSQNKQYLKMEQEVHQVQRKKKVKLVRKGSRLLNIIAGFLMVFAGNRICGIL